MLLFNIEYKDDYGIEREQIIISKGLPSPKRIKKLLNMYSYCNSKMSDEHYKEFIIKAGNYIDFEIDNIEELKYIKN